MLYLHNMTNCDACDDRRGERSIIRTSIYLGRPRPHTVIGLTPYAWKSYSDDNCHLGGSLWDRLSECGHTVFQFVRCTKWYEGSRPFRDVFVSTEDDYAVWTHRDAVHAYRKQPRHIAR